MKKISKVIDTSNPFFELVDRLKIKKERYILGDLLSAKPGTRPSKQRGKKVSEQKLEALIWRVEPRQSSGSLACPKRIGMCCL